MSDFSNNVGSRIRSASQIEPRNSGVQSRNKDNAASIGGKKFRAGRNNAPIKVVFIIKGKKQRRMPPFQQFVKFAGSKISGSKSAKYKALPNFKETVSRTMVRDNVDTQTAEKSTIAAIKKLEKTGLDPQKADLALAESFDRVQYSDYRALPTFSESVRRLGIIDKMSERNAEKAAIKIVDAFVETGLTPQQADFQLSLAIDDAEQEIDDETMPTSPFLVGGDYSRPPEVENARPLAPPPDLHAGGDTTGNARPLAPPPDLAAVGATTDNARHLAPPLENSNDTSLSTEEVDAEIDRLFENTDGLELNIDEFLGTNKTTLGDFIENASHQKQPLPPKG